MATSLVNNKYRITRRIGGGSFGEITWVLVQVVKKLLSNLKDMLLVVRS